MPTLRRIADRYLPRGALLLATLTLATYAMGLLRDRLFARTFGLSHDLDTYNAAFVLPELALDVLIASGLTAPFVPIFLALKEGRGATGPDRPTTPEGIVATDRPTGADGPDRPTGADRPDRPTTPVAPDRPTSADRPGRPTTSDGPVAPETARPRDADAALPGDADAEAFGQSILTLAVVVMGLASAVLFVAAPLTVDLIAPGFGPAQRVQYVDLFRVMLATPILFAASIAVGEILVAERRFLFYGLAPLLYNAGLVFGAAVLADRLGIFGPAWGAVIGAVAHLAIRILGVARTGFRLRPRWDPRSRPVREFVALMVPKMASQPIEPITFLFFTSLATTIGMGAVSAVSFARNFQSLPVSLIGIAFSVAAFPTLAAAAADGDRGRFVALIRRDAITIATLSIAAAVALLLLGGLLIRLFLGGGAFGEADAATTTLVLAAFALSIPFESLLYLFSRAIYATRNTVLAVLANLAGFAVTVAVGAVTASALGIVAIPVAFTVGTAVKIGLLVVALARRADTIGPAISDPSSAPPR